MSPLYFTLKSQLEELRCELTDARAEIHHLKAEKGSTGSGSGATEETQELISRFGRLFYLFYSGIESCVLVV